MSHTGAGGGDAGDGADQFFGAAGLAQQRRDAGTAAGFAIFNLSEAGEDDDRAGGIGFVDPGGDFPTVDAGHRQVADDQVKAVGGDELQRPGAAVGVDDGAVLTGEDANESAAHDVFIVDDEDGLAGGLNMFRGQYWTQFKKMMAVAVLILLPVILILFFQ